MNNFIQLSSESRNNAQKSIYNLANYDKNGLLISVYQKEGLHGIIKSFSNEFREYMYNDGQGIVSYDNNSSYSVCHIAIENNFNPNQLVVPKKVCWKLNLRGRYGETLLHILIICNTKIHTSIAMQLLSMYPKLSNDVFEDKQYLGVSALHLAIVYKNEELVELLLESGADVNQRATGNFFMPHPCHKGSKSPSFNAPRYFGEYPLSWAASIDDKIVYNSLINYGADPNLVDTFGNMVLHVIVAREKLMIFGFALHHPVRPALNDMANNYGLTPLALACVLGKAKIFREIIELSCQEFWTYNIVTCCGYPLNVVDSMQMESADTRGRSALAIILEGNNSEHLDMLKGGVIQKLLEEKWKTFGHNQFIRRIFLALLHLLILSLAIFLRPPRNSSNICENEIKKIIRWILEVLACISCIRQIFGQVLEFTNKRNSSIFQNLISSLPQSASLLSNLLICISFISRFLSLVSVEEICIIFALPCSWYSLMFFAAAVRLTGPFVSMIRYMILEDMRQFSIIYLVFLYGFSQAFYFLLKRPLHQLKVSNNASYHESWMELFRMTLGAHEYEKLRSSYYHWLTQFFFVLFMILMPILLLNMLIAMMGNTYAQVISQSEREWNMQWAKILLQLEKSLSPKEAKMFLSQYTIPLTPKSDSDKPGTCLMVIKKMSTSKAKKRKEAVANWKRLKWRVKMFINKQAMSANNEVSTYL